MKVSIIVGSPRPSGSTSAVLASALTSKLEGKAQLREYVWNTHCATAEQMHSIVFSDAIVFAFSLYIDSIPSHLLRCLVDMERYVKENGISGAPKVYVLLNNGFYDGCQNINAIRNMESWCECCGFTFANGAGFGGGGMLNMLPSLPEKHGPMNNVHAKLHEIAQHILSGETAPISFTLPNYPSFLYTVQAEMGWRRMVKRNGLKKRDLFKRMV